MQTDLKSHPLAPTNYRSAAEAIALRGLHEILQARALHPWFQQVIDLQSGEIVGYESLIRGPSNSPYHAPMALFAEAQRLGLTDEMEDAARLCSIRRFSELDLPGKLFLNVSPPSLAGSRLRDSVMLDVLRESELPASRVIIELTENKPFFDVAGITDALKRLREAGFTIAIDDLGAGFSTLRLWSDLLPEIVKLDMHFVQGTHRDPVKFAFLRSVQDIAARCGTHLVAEGIETEEDLLAVRKLGIRYGQGYFIARPLANPALSVSTGVRRLLSAARMQLLPEESPLAKQHVTVERLMSLVAAFEATMTNNDVFNFFEAHQEQIGLPIVASQVPVGLVNRHRFMDQFARQYGREIYGRRSCLEFADRMPLIVEKTMLIHNLSRTLVESASRHLSEGFIVTDNGKYLGYGTGQDLVREITQMQIEAARYANPLTLLPGNVPIDEHVQRLLHAGMHFVACHCDLDWFKPFNDTYGYHRGDEMIVLAARVLADACDPASDFVGHVGGDDFVLLLQSSDWEARIHGALKAFERDATSLFDQRDRDAGGFRCLDRQGREQLFPLTALSIGVVIVEPGTFQTHRDVAARASEAKKQAKRVSGSTCFVERRAAQASLF